MSYELTRTQLLIALLKAKDETIEAKTEHLKLLLKNIADVHDQLLRIEKDKTAQLIVAVTADSVPTDTPNQQQPGNGDSN